MKVVHVLESTATGTLSIVCMIANRLVRDGHEVHVIYSERDETPRDLHALFHSDVVLQHLQMKGPSLTSILFGMRRRLVDLKPDVVHLHSSFAGFLGRLSTVFCLPSTAFLYSPHCISFMRSDVGRLKRFLFAALELLACVKFCTYIGCSESECAAIRRHLRRHAVLIENATDGTVADRIDDRARLANSSAVRRVVTVGGIRTQKNPQLFAAVARSFRRNNTEFVWIGDGDLNLKRTRLDAGVSVTGWLPRVAVIDAVARADVYLSTSSWEGMPVSVIEAMSLGTPVVASRCPGNIDVVRNGATGVMYDTASEATALLERVMDDKAFGNAIKSRAQDEARERFSEDRFFGNLALVYASRLERVRAFGRRSAPSL